jgi:hypothetical protein
VRGGDLITADDERVVRWPRHKNQLVKTIPPP